MLFDVEYVVGLLDHDIANNFMLLMTPIRQKTTREGKGGTGVHVNKSNL